MNAAPASARNDRAGVVDAAMRVLAENGVPGLSMRRIADVLDVQVSALYWHFPNKQTLLAAVSERIVALADEAPDAAPDLAAIATTLRERLLAQRDGAELVSSSLALGLLELPSRTRLEAAALAAGLDEASAGIAADTVVHYVIGYTFHEQQRMHAAVVGAADASVDLAPAQIADSGDTFDAGLAMVVAGVRAAAGAHPGEGIASRSR
ncbi:TetR family transcriptional regulator [Microbacterium murale]|uniref:TetR/AcrR family tetracycline transcriptional repressor n=1 Tax=Microbacterium murale TaxID=1081040 RepID=A0ABU0P9T5_9MICO|nr:TetR family transcriptional regulator [Microbacterium murale]MDQ0643722.1 TetR/AcrR family tetracycline transcriptional repressor [Microbacterium murale]